MEKEMKFQVAMKVPYMFDFQMHHAYRGVGGIIGILVSVGAFVLWINGFGQDTTQNILLLITAALFTVYQPIHLYYKAFKQVKLNPAFKEPLNYTVSEEGITVGQGEEEGTISWEEVGRVIETRKSVIVYTSNVYGFIFPKDCLKEQMADFKEILRAKVDPKWCKLK